MSRWIIAIAAAAALSGCKGEGEAATDRYEFLKENGASSGELCLAARDAADAYSRDQDDEGYRKARVEAALACLRASQERGH